MNKHTKKDKNYKKNCLSENYVVMYELCTLLNDK